MSPVQRLATPDLLERKVLFAVELLDPIAQAVVSQGVTVRAAGLSHEPIVNHSGQFVWLRKDDGWPGVISVTPGRLPFAAHIALAPKRPDDLDTATIEQRRVRITLRPTAAYNFDAGVTAMRGRLCESTEDKVSPAVVGIRVQLAWQDQQTMEWVPPPPVPEDVDESQGDLPSPREVETDGHGEFASFLRIPPPKSAQLDDHPGMLKVRLQFTRGRAHPETRLTPEDFAFLPNAPKGCVPEGRLLTTDLKLGWAELHKP